MTRWLTWFAVAVTVGALVYSDLTWRKRRYERELRDRAESIAHRVDIGVELRTVVADPRGEELLPGKPRVRVVRTRRAGGILDTELGRLVGPSRNPTIWYCSEEQEPVILHADTAPLGTQVVGSEGSGKTTLLPMWHYFRWLEHIGERREGGQTAPIRNRLAMFLRELHALWPRGWYWYVKSEQLLILADGTRLQLVSTHQQSEEEGSKLQGYSWSWAGADEMQDQVRYATDHESRGRSAKHGRYKQCRTATPKDSYAWRTYRDVLATSGTWRIVRMLGPRSPFIAPEFWEAKRAVMTKREHDRRVLAMDVGPERQLYHTWARDENLRPVPQLGAVDVTEMLLRPWGEGLSMLAGYDPGKLFDVTELLKAYGRLDAMGRIRDYDWFVVDEVTTEQTTTDQHVQAVLERVRGTHGINLLDRQGRPSGPQLLVRADPYSDNEGDKHPDRSVYTTWRKRNVLIHPAAYRAATDVVKPGRIPKEARIDMVTTLFCNAERPPRRRLFVACDERRAPAAPRLVEAVETMERDEIGKAEMEKKNLRDLSHWPAAVGYALWVIERPRLARSAA